MKLPHPYVLNQDGTVSGFGVQANFDAINALGDAKGRVVSGGKANIATSESTTSTTYTKLTTPDQVTVVLPTDGLLAVAYQALWQNTVTVNSRAAIFLNSNQLKVAPSGGAGTVPVVAEATGNATINIDTPLVSTAAGLSSTNNTGNVTEVTTGQVINHSNINAAGGVAYIFAAAGTYTVSIQFKNVAAGTLTAKNRHLWVWTQAFA